MPSRVPFDAACLGLEPKFFDAKTWDASLVGLNACWSCTVRYECLRLVDPARNYYDGIAGGYVWVEGVLREWSIHGDIEPLKPYYASLGMALTLPEVTDPRQEEIGFNLLDDSRDTSGG